MNQKSLDTIEKLFHYSSLNEIKTNLGELIERIIEIKSNSDQIEFIVDKFEVFIKKLTKNEKFIQDEQIINLIISFLNLDLFPRKSILILNIKIIDFLESEKTSVYKIESARKGFIESIFVKTILDDTNLMKLGNEIANLSEEEYESYLNIVFNLPNKVSNYLESCPQVLKNETFYISFFHSSTGDEKTSGDYFLTLLNKMIGQSQIKTLIQYWWNFIEAKDGDLTSNFEKMSHMKWTAGSPNRIPSYFKILREFLSYLSNIKTHNIEDLINLYLKFYNNIESSQFINEILPKFISDKNLNLDSVNFLLAVLDKYFKPASDYAIYHQALECALMTWQDSNFIRKASVLHLKFLTNFVRSLIKKSQKVIFLKSEIITLIQDGMSNRLSENFTSAFHRKCGEAVWTSFIRKMELPEAIEILEKEKLYDDFLYEDASEVAKRESEEEKPELPTLPKQSKKKEEIKFKQDSDSDEEFITIEPQADEENIFTLTKPKHLYDCLLGLRSDNYQRVEYSLKHVNYLIRKNLSDIQYIAEELVLTLCKMNNAFNWDKFEEYRSRALISLAILIPDVISNCLIKRFFHSETSLGEKITLIEILEKASDELSDNPAKYNPENFNEFEETQDFYFKPVVTKYFTEEEKKKDEIKKIQDEKVESKSRRWGDTRRKREDETIIPLKKKELMIINSDTQQVFINRFNSLCNHFFFPLIIPLREKRKYLLRDPILLAKIIRWISTYLKNAKNSPMFYTILEEALDFLLVNIKSEDQAVQAQLFRCFYMLSTMLNKNIVLYYNNIVQKLLLLMKLVSDLVAKNEKFKILIYEISNNIQKLFEVELPNY